MSNTKNDAIEPGVSKTGNFSLGRGVDKKTESLSAQDNYARLRVKFESREFEAAVARARWVGLKNINKYSLPTQAEAQRKGGK
jgi:hypothetical protein